MSASHRAMRAPGAIVACALLSVALFGAAVPRPAQAQQTVKMEWLGWSFFRFTSPTGKVILTNPWVSGNPDASVKLDEVSRADLILVSDGHRDEVGDAVAIAGKTGAKIVAPFELGTLLIASGVPEAQVQRRNPGARYVLDGITVRVVNAVHGSAFTRPGADGPLYSGPAAGFIVTFENGWTVYFTGSSAATQDMALWGSLYKPDAMIFLMAPASEPQDIGMAIKLVATGNPNLKTLWPHHHRVTPPPGAATVADVRKVLDSMEINIPILNQERGKVYEFTK